MCEGVLAFNESHRDYFGQAQLKAQKWQLFNLEEMAEALYSMRQILEFFLSPFILKKKAGKSKNLKKKKTFVFRKVIAVKEIIRTLKIPVFI